MAHLELDGATAIVTGASRGIGPHIATALANKGARVALVARSGDELEANAQTLRDGGANAIAVVADVTSAAARRETVQQVERAFGPIDLLVNNAGGDAQRQFHNLGPDEIERLIDLNLTSAVLLTRLVLPGMLARGRGHVVNVSSMAGRTSFPFTEAYAAAKDGLVGFTRVLRGDYRRQGVSASTLILGPVRDEGIGARTAAELGLKVPPFVATPDAVARAAVRAITRDKAELTVLPGPGRTLRAVIDRFPGLGPAMNRAAGAEKTMLAVAEHREREIRSADSAVTNDRPSTPTHQEIAHDHEHDAHATDWRNPDVPSGGPSSSREQEI